MASAVEDKTVAASEKAFAEAAAGSINEKAVEKAVEADAPKTEVKPAKIADAIEADKKPAPKKASAPKKAAKAAKPKKAKPAAKKAPVAKKAKAPVKSAAPKKVATKKKAAPKKKAAADVTIPSLKKKATKTKTQPKSKITELKETIMAKKNTKTITDTVKTTFGDMQARAKTAYEKSTAVAGEAVEFNKHNVEALVESGKVLASGMQDMGKVYVEELKGAYETMTGDMKEFAAVKSPTELFQLQGKLARRNFDNAIAFGSKNTEMMVKLANDAFAPISNRVSVAAEKISKAA